MGEQDAAIFHRYAEYLWQRAGGIVARRALAGAVLGAALGSVMLTPWANWPLPHREVYLLIVLGAVSGGFLGRSSGATRALGLQLQAQLAQHQLQFERYTLAQGHVPPEPAAQLPYVPTGAPPVSATEPVVAEPVAPVLPAVAAVEPVVAGPVAPVLPVVAAAEPLTSAGPVTVEGPVASAGPSVDDGVRPSYGWQAIEPANS